MDVQLMQQTYVDDKNQLQPLVAIGDVSSAAQLSLPRLPTLPPTAAPDLSPASQPGQIITQAPRPPVSTMRAPTQSQLRMQSSVPVSLSLPQQVAAPVRGSVPVTGPVPQPVPSALSVSRNMLRQTAMPMPSGQIPAIPQMTGQGQIRPQVPIQGTQPLRVQGSIPAGATLVPQVSMQALPNGTASMPMYGQSWAGLTHTATMPAVVSQAPVSVPMSNSIPAQMPAALPTPLSVAGCFPVRAPIPSQIQMPAAVPVQPVTGMSHVMALPQNTAMPAAPVQMPLVQQIPGTAVVSQPLQYQQMAMNPTAVQPAMPSVPTTLVTQPSVIPNLTAVGVSAPLTNSVGNLRPQLPVLQSTAAVSTSATTIRAPFVSTNGAPFVVAGGAAAVWDSGTQPPVLNPSGLGNDNDTHVMLSSYLAPPVEVKTEELDNSQQAPVVNAPQGALPTEAPPDSSVVFDTPQVVMENVAGDTLLPPVHMQGLETAQNQQQIVQDQRQSMQTVAHQGKPKDPKQGKLPEGQHRKSTGPQGKATGPQGKATSQQQGNVTKKIDQEPKKGKRGKKRKSIEKPTATGSDIDDDDDDYVPSLPDIESEEPLPEINALGRSKRRAAVKAGNKIHNMISHIDQPIPPTRSVTVASTPSKKKKVPTATLR